MKTEQASSIEIILLTMSLSSTTLKDINEIFTSSKEPGNDRKLELLQKGFAEREIYSGSCDESLLGTVEI